MNRMPTSRRATGAFHLLALFFLIATFWSIPAQAQVADLDCVICTGSSYTPFNCAIDVIDQLLIIHPEPVVQFVMDQFCKLFSNELQDVCNEFITIYGPAIIAGLESFENADDICHGIGLCSDANCKLFPTRTDPDFEQFVKTQPRYSLRDHPLAPRIKPQNLNNNLATAFIHSASNLITDLVSKKNPENTLTLRQLLETLRGRMEPGWQRRWAQSPNDSPWDWIIELIDRMMAYHLPLVDADGDHMSIAQGLRGSNWRGRDCNDLDSKMFDSPS